MLAVILELQQITTIKHNGSVLAAGGVQCCDSNSSVRAVQML